MKYFAMIDGEQKGPLTLQELPAAGVTPDTYVWCKGMADWEKAGDVADICRFFRQRIAALQHPGSVAMPGTPDDESTAQKEAGSDDDGLTPEQREALEQLPPRFRNFVRRSGLLPESDNELEGPSPDMPPRSWIFLAFISTVFCFPVTGVIAIYYAFKAQKEWAQAVMSDQKDSSQMKLKAHDTARKAKLWTGITISLGLIMTGIVYGISGI